MLLVYKMSDDYICSKCSEKLGREARHKQGSQIHADHMKFIKNGPKTPDIIIDESDGIPEDLIQGVLENNFDIELQEQDNKPVFTIKSPLQQYEGEIDLAKIPLDWKFIRTNRGLMMVVRDATGKPVGLFDPNDSIEKINFRMLYWGWYIPDPDEFECRKFVTRPFTEIEKLKYASTITQFQHKKYSWFQRIKDAKKLKDLLIVKQNAKPS